MVLISLEKILLNLNLYFALKLYSYIIEFVIITLALLILLKKESRLRSIYIALKRLFLMRS